MASRRTPNDRATDFATRLLERLSPEQVQSLSEQLLSTIDEVSSDRWEAAQRRAAALPGTLRPEKLRALTRRFTRELTAAGVAVGAAAAAPVVGTVPTVVATLAEMSWFTARAGDLVLTIAALHGRPEPTPDERRAWVLAVLMYGSSARNEFNQAINQASTGVAAETQTRVPLATIQTVNQVLGKAFMRRYGTRRGMISAVQVLPIGIGAVLGGAANYVSVRRLARNADRFFARLPYSSIDTHSEDISGRQLGAG